MIFQSLGQHLYVLFAWLDCDSLMMYFKTFDTLLLYAYHLELYWNSINELFNACTPTSWLYSTTLTTNDGTLLMVTSHEHLLWVNSNYYLVPSVE